MRRRRSNRPLRSDRDQLGYLEVPVQLSRTKAGEHRWFVPNRVYPHLQAYESCQDCGVVRGPRSESKPCPGPMSMELEDWFR